MNWVAAFEPGGSEDLSTASLLMAWLSACRTLTFFRAGVAWLKAR
jgi:hypothetical protein